MTRGVALAASSALAIACGGTARVVATPTAPLAPEQVAELWVDPGPQARDLYWSVGGQQYAPRQDVVYAFKAKDEAGFSVSYDVRGPDDIEWSATIGPEAQTEVVVSRLFWGLGYHQPPAYYLSSWKVGHG